MSTPQQKLELFDKGIEHEFHGGYAWWMILGDGEPLCTTCCHNEQDLIRAHTLEPDPGRGDQWAFEAWGNSGDLDEGAGVTCAHCNKIIVSENTHEPV